MSTDPWPGEWLRGVLDVCVLAVLAEGTTYGYAISARLDELGLGAVKGGTLYPLLTRLEQAGLVTTAVAAGRRRTRPQVLRAHGRRSRGPRPPRRRLARASPR